MTPTTATAENRARLLSMAAGGDGHVRMWIEHAIYEATDTEPEAEVYLLHVPPRILAAWGQDGGEFCGTLEQCGKMAHILHGMPDDYTAPTPEETMRRVPPQRQLPRGGGGCLRIDSEP